MLTGDLSIVVSHATGDLAESLDWVVATRPQLAIIDCSCGKIDVLDALAHATQRSPHTRFLLTAVLFSGTDLVRAHAAGVCAFVLKSDMPGEFRAAIQDTLDGRFVCSRKLREQFDIQWDRESNGLSVSGPLSGLTKREIQVLTNIGQGFSTKEIAVALKVSPKTVDRHKASVMLKLDTHDRVLLAHCAIREGLVSLWKHYQLR